MDEPINSTELLTNSEAADFLRSSTVSLWRLRKEGLPFHRINRKLLYRRSELEAFLQQNRRSSGGKYDQK
jgi:Helix-turn-helix domain